ncbi:MAG TPA: FlgD immunoglobulin-like domain containing protein [Candidatus Deferrimicrobium sp.]|nr:FlgD immunoglobulin-like domain containing protein [Candidatus Deferrimicrobium sp.]
MTRSVANTYWNINLFSSPQAANQSYILDPWGELVTAMSFALDDAWNRIVYFESLDDWIREYGSWGIQNCQFWWPKSIAALAPFDDSTYSWYYYVYVADTQNDRILRLRFDWRSWNQFWLCDSPISGGGLDRPVDLDLNDGFTFYPETDDYLWVLNGSGQIKRFTPDGILRSTTGTQGCDGLIGQFCSPTAVVSGRGPFIVPPSHRYANTDHLYVADAGNRRIVWLIKLHGGEDMYWWGSIGSTSSIVDLEVDAWGQLWAVDEDNGRIIKYTSDLFPLCTYGSSGVGERQFLKPISISSYVGYYGVGDMYVVEAWTDSSGGQYFGIGTDVLGFTASSSQSERWNYFTYTLVDPSFVTLKIYNTAGQLVKTLYQDAQLSGPCSFVWDGSNNSGARMGTANYRVKLVDTSTYVSMETGAPVNVVTKEAWFHHVYNPGYDYIPGDVNDDGTVNIEDMTYLIAFLFSGGPAPVPHMCVADIDASGGVNVSDLTWLVAFLFTQGAAPLDGCQLI